MTGECLRQLLLQKWGHSYDVQIRRIGETPRVQVQVMWRYQEQASFPLSEPEYLQHLQVVADHLQAWGLSQQFQQFIDVAKHRPRLGKPTVFSVNLGDGLGTRALEWLV